ncbi:MAG: hypothetical protein M0C28_19200 [Candidatus Moduliflexus flocculans]|nr:hypothetical protein [Candidatus Moduliflexus flocculans]
MALVKRQGSLVLRGPVHRYHLRLPGLQGDRPRDRHRLPEADDPGNRPLRPRAGAGRHRAADRGGRGHLPRMDRPLAAFRPEPARRRHVLIIGGGDCGVAREVLRHQSVEKVTMVEIDRMVCDLCRRHMPSVSEGVYEDPRFKLIVGDGAEVIRQMKGKCDVIVIDSTDPIGPAQEPVQHRFLPERLRRPDRGRHHHPPDRGADPAALRGAGQLAPDRAQLRRRARGAVRQHQLHGRPLQPDRRLQGQGRLQERRAQCPEGVQKGRVQDQLVFAADIGRPLSRIPETAGDRQVRRRDRHGRRAARPTAAPMPSRWPSGPPRPARPSR